jgi:hypothetical protein
VPVGTANEYVCSEPTFVLATDVTPEVRPLMLQLRDVPAGVFQQV